MLDCASAALLQYNVWSVRLTRLWKGTFLIVKVLQSFQKNVKVVGRRYRKNTEAQTCHLVLKEKEWTMYSVRPSNSGCTRIVRRARKVASEISSYLSAPRH